MIDILKILKMCSCNSSCNEKKKKKDEMYKTIEEIKDITNLLKLRIDMLQELFEKNISNHPKT